MTTTYGTLFIGAAGLNARPSFSYDEDGTSDYMVTDPLYGQRIARRTQSSASRNTGQYETLGWGLTLDQLSDVERDLVLASWNAGTGNARPLLWTPGDFGAAIPVVFVGSTITVERTTPNNWSIRCLVREVI